MGARLLYDPDCGFCKVTAAALLTWDLRGRLRPVPLGSPEADRLLAGMPEERRMASWHLVDASGKGQLRGRRLRAAAAAAAGRLAPRAARGPAPGGRA